MNNSGKRTLLADKILRSILNNKNIASKARGISAVELLKKLESENIPDSAKIILLGLLFSAIMGKMKLSDFAALFDRMFSQPPDLIGGLEVDLSERGKAFLKEHKIAEKDMRIVAKVILGVPLREFPNQLGISSSTVNKRIRQLCERLGLRNREQLIYVFGYLHLISLDLKCLRAGEKVTNLSSG